MVRTQAARFAAPGPTILLALQLAACGGSGDGDGLPETGAETGTDAGGGDTAPGDASDTPPDAPPDDAPDTPDAPDEGSAAPLPSTTALAPGAAEASGETYRLRTATGPGGVISRSSRFVLRRAAR